jgi:hypothetical protein
MDIGTTVLATEPCLTMMNDVIVVDCDKVQAERALPKSEVDFVQLGVNLLQK